MNIDRPKLETELDKKREHIALRYLERHYNWHGVELIFNRYKIDWAFFENNRAGAPLTAWGEFKYRSKKFASYLISSDKYAKMVDLQNTSGVPAYLFIKYQEEDFIWQHQVRWELLQKLTLGGSPKTNEFEPVVTIPHSEFESIAFK